MGSQAAGLKTLITGGGGFLGSVIAKMLHDRGDDVTVLGRNTYPQLKRYGIKTVQADVTDRDSVLQVCKGMDVVFHVAALAAIWGRRKDFWNINVEGTRNVIDACRRLGISKLIYTSTPSVVFGHESLCFVDESQPYPQTFLSHYAETKAIAEQLVLAANGTELATVALRPHMIWGPGDPHLIPRVIDRARRGKLIQVGSGKNLVDVTYIDNAADAHILSADELGISSKCSGQVYFISQGEPVSLWPWLNQLLEAMGAPTVTRTMSFQTAYRIGATLEGVCRLLGVRSEPRMTRFLALQLAKSHHFNISAARRDFGYVPKISIEEGVRRLVGSSSNGESTASRIKPRPSHEGVAVH